MHFLSGNPCTPTLVANSDKSVDGSVTGKTGDTVTVICVDGYTGSGTVTCQANGTFTGLTCITGNTHTHFVQIIPN